MGDTAKKFGKRKKNENGEQMTQENAPERTKRAIDDKAGGKNKRRKKLRRTVGKPKAGAGTDGAGGEEETGGAENRREPMAGRKGHKDRD